MRKQLLATISVLALALTACGTNDTATTDDDVATTPTPETEVGTDDLDATPGDETAAADDTSSTEEPTPATESDGEGEGEGAQQITQAVDATFEEGSARFDAVTTIDSEEFSERGESSGVIDFTGDRRQVDVQTAAGTVTALITQDGYLLSAGGDTGWVRLDPQDLRGTPVEASGLATLPLQDPSLNLALLRGATDDVTEVGEEDIDGESVTRYEVMVDAAAAAGQADAATGETIRALGGDGQLLPMDVWIDDQDRIRRLEHRGDFADVDLIQGQTEGSFELRMDLTDFGAEVDIEEPGADEIVDVDEQTLELLIRQATAGT